MLQNGKLEPAGGHRFIGSGYFITWYGFHERLSTAEYVPQLEITWGYETINVAMVATGIFLLIKNIRIKSPDSSCGKLVTDISIKSYGIYLIHIMLLNLFYDLLNNLSDSAMIRFQYRTLHFHYFLSNDQSPFLSAKE